MITEYSGKVFRPPYIGAQRAPREMNRENRPSIAKRFRLDSDYGFRLGLFLDCSGFGAGFVVDVLLVEVPSGELTETLETPEPSGCLRIARLLLCRVVVLFVATVVPFGAVN
jgi:hypothetical protein